MALTGLSAALVWKLGYGMSTADPAYRTVMQEARAAAEHAVSIAPGLGLPHALRGMVLLAGVTDLSAAWTEAIRARALTPGDATVEENYAQIAMAVGRTEEAMKAASHAVDLDPLQPQAWFTTMRVMVCARKFDAARDALRRGVDILGHRPSFVDYILGSILLKQGKPDAARQICEAGAMWTDVCLAIAYHALGRQNEAESQCGEDVRGFGRRQFLQPCRCLCAMESAGTRHALADKSERGSAILPWQTWNAMPGWTPSVPSLASGTSSGACIFLRLIDDFAGRRTWCRTSCLRVASGQRRSSRRRRGWRRCRARRISRWRIRRKWWLLMENKPIKRKLWIGHSPTRRMRRLSQPNILLNRAEWIAFVSHDEDDGTWQFHAAGRAFANECEPVGVSLLSIVGN